MSMVLAVIMKLRKRCNQLHDLYYANGIVKSQMNNGKAVSCKHLSKGHPYCMNVFVGVN